MDNFKSVASGDGTDVHKYSDYMDDDDDDDQRSVDIGVYYLEVH